jgi:hypothetical protein
MTAHLIVGIDPGVSTGFAVWNKAARQLVDVRTLGIIDAMVRVRLMHDMGSLHSVVFEDARLRSWFGSKGREALQGAGSIKRESGIWEEFLTGLTGIPFKPVSPLAKGAKLDAVKFAKLTKWTGRTSEHSRDAAMLILGL